MVRDLSIACANCSQGGFVRVRELVGAPAITAIMKNSVISPKNISVWQIYLVRNNWMSVAMYHMFRYPSSAREVDGHIKENGKLQAYEEESQSHQGTCQSSRTDGFGFSCS